MIANVNNSTRVAATRSKTKLAEQTAKTKYPSKKAVTSTKRKSAGIVASDEIDQPKKLKTGKSKKIDKEAKHQSHQDGADNTARFMEDDQFIQMQVEANEDNYSGNESSDEAEIEQSSYSENESTLPDSSDESADSEIKFRDSQSSAKSVDDGKIAAEKKSPSDIDIDKEMAIKLKQLQEMMVRGGLSESVEVLERGIKITEQKDHVKTKEKGNVNSNTNASVK